MNDEIEIIYKYLTPEAEEMDNLKKTYNEFEKVIKKVMEQSSFQYDLVIYGSSVDGLTMRKMEKNKAKVAPKLRVIESKNN